MIFYQNRFRIVHLRTGKLFSGRVKDNIATTSIDYGAFRENTDNTDNVNDLSGNNIGISSDNSTGLSDNISADNNNRINGNIAGRSSVTINSANATAEEIKKAEAGNDDMPVRGNLTANFN